MQVHLGGKFYSQYMKNKLNIIITKPISFEKILGIKTVDTPQVL